MGVWGSVGFGVGAPGRVAKGSMSTNVSQAGVVSGCFRNEALRAKMQHSQLIEAPGVEGPKG